MTARRPILVLAFTAAVCLAQPAVTGVRNFHRVNEQLYRGGQPTAAGFENLAKMGVRTVVDLRGGERSEKALVEAHGMEYVQVPFGALSRPKDASIERVLALLDESAAAGRPVYVHCLRGKDRTGTVVAVYRIAHDGWTNRQALDEARKFGLSRWARSMSKYILRYTPAGRAAATAAP